MSTETTRWWLVRHAPVVGVEGIIYGADDVQCDLSDLTSFQALARRLPGDAEWYTSHLSRAKLTAKTIRDAGLKTPDPIIDERFGEQSFGDWQGSTWDQMRDVNPVVYDKFWEDPVRNRTPNGESFADQIQRVGEAIEHYTAKHAGRDIVCVSHGGTVRAAVSHALNLDPAAGLALTVHTLSVTVMEHVPGGLLRGKGAGWRILNVNRPAREDH
jgi:alpha-ribazole phosphatase